MRMLLLPSDTSAARRASTALRLTTAPSILLFLPMLPPRAVLALVLLSATSMRAQTAPPQGAWVNLASDGRLLYTRDALGNRVLDFGDCGYKAGREPIPVVPVKVTLTPDSNTTDDTARIQAAIDQVEALTPDAN